MNKIKCSLLPFGFFRKRPVQCSDSEDCIGCASLTIKGKAVHYVLRIPDRREAIRFFKDILGMRILRHEEFSTGCGPACKGFCGSLWSKTMVGYGPEEKFFAFELAYGYSNEKFTIGNALCSITIKDRKCLQKASKGNWPIDEGNILVAPGGYRFIILDEQMPKDFDPVQKITLSSSDLKKTVKYWSGLLGVNMCLLDHKKQICGFRFKESPLMIEFQHTNEKINHDDSFGRLCVTCPLKQLTKIERAMVCTEHTIITPLTTVKSNRKGTYHVIVLADPDDHEISFQDEISYKKIARFNPEAGIILNRYVELECGVVDESLSKKATDLKLGNTTMDSSARTAKRLSKDVTSSKTTSESKEGKIRTATKSSNDANQLALPKISFNKDEIPTISNLEKPDNDRKPVSFNSLDLEQSEDKATIKYKSGEKPSDEASKLDLPDKRSNKDEIPADISNYEKSDKDGKTASSKFLDSEESQNKSAVKYKAGEKPSDEASKLALLERGSTNKDEIPANIYNPEKSDNDGKPLSSKSLDLEESQNKSAIKYKAGEKPSDEASKPALPEVDSSKDEIPADISNSGKSDKDGKTASSKYLDSEVKYKAGEKPSDEASKLALPERGSNKDEIPANIYNPEKSDNDGNPVSSKSLDLEEPQNKSVFRYKAGPKPSDEERNPALPEVDSSKDEILANASNLEKVDIEGNPLSNKLSDIDEPHYSNSAQNTTELKIKDREEISNKDGKSALSEKVSNNDETPAKIPSLEKADENGKLPSGKLSDPPDESPNPTSAEKTEFKTKTEETPFDGADRPEKHTNKDEKYSNTTNLDHIDDEMLSKLSDDEKQTNPKDKLSAKAQSEYDTLNEERPAPRSKVTSTATEIDESGKSINTFRMSDIKSISSVQTNDELSESKKAMKRVETEKVLSPKRGISKSTVSQWKQTRLGIDHGTKIN